MSWFAKAPSNIALIKYMGKTDPSQNLPLNPSLSYTLENLFSEVILLQNPSGKDTWEPLLISNEPDFFLSQAAQNRFLAHLARLKNYFKYPGGFRVKSRNNFPHGAGLASSASSFAALTRCATQALCDLTETKPLSVELQAQLSRQGSGSSCRSFFKPFALWAGESVQAIELPFSQLIHQVILIDAREKQINSSSAHLKVQTSPRFENRMARSSHHLNTLIESLQKKDWAESMKICWDEFEDMHQLFETANPPFSYRTDSTHEVLNTLRAFWDKHGDGPLVTMDAGPNIHLLYREDQVDLAAQLKNDPLVRQYHVL